MKEQNRAGSGWLLVLILPLFITSPRFSDERGLESTNESRHTVRSTIPSLFAMADDSILLEKKAKFVLATRKRRRRIFEESVKTHYDSIENEEMHSLEALKRKYDQRPCIYHIDRQLNFPWTAYEICEEKFVNKMELQLIHDQSDLKLIQRRPVQLVKIREEMYFILKEEKLGNFLQIGKNSDEVLNLIWGDDNSILDYKGGILQNYVEGDICEVNQSKFNAVRIMKNGCCRQSSSELSLSALESAMKVEEKEACKFTIRLCNICSNDKDSENVNAAMVENNNGKKSASSITTDNLLLKSDEQMENGENGSWVQDLRQSLPGSLPPMPPSQVRSNLKLIKQMFQHAYDSYMYHGYPAGSEVKPISCKPSLFNLVRLPALTLIDSLDTLLIMKNHTEFARSVERLRVLDDSMRMSQPWTNGLEKGGIFAVDQNVSVFETNIRILGGLLSAHQMADLWMENKAVLRDIFSDIDGKVMIGEISRRDFVPVEKKVENSEGMQGKRIYHGNFEEGEGTECNVAGIKMDPYCENIKNCQRNVTNSKETANYWKYDGFLLKLAEDIGGRLLAAFKTPTGIPYGTVNLLHGVPNGETTIASMAGGGSLSIEMELLSRLTRNDMYGKASRLSTRALWSRRSKLDLLGKHINVENGLWTEQLAGVGSNSDSMYEYLIKHHILFPEDEDFFTMFNNTYSGIFRNGRLGDWYPDVPMNSGLSGAVSTIFESLASFFPGMQVLLGEITNAARSINSFTVVREYLKFLPETFDFVRFDVVQGHGTYPLRPELYESTYFLHLATKYGKSETSNWLWSADFFTSTLEQITKAQCGFSTASSLSSLNLPLEMEDEMPSYFLSETLKYLYLTFDADNPINTDRERNWIFTTEAHPIHSVPRIDSNILKRKRAVSDEDLWLSSAKDIIMSSLDTMIESRVSSKKATPAIIIQTKPSMYLQQEKWSQQTSKYMHMKDVQKASMKMSEVDKNSHKIELYGRIMNVPRKVIELESTRDDVLNFAYLEHNLRGRETGLSKSCPNHYHSNSLWINALEGDEFKYSETFDPTISNDSIILKMKRRLPSSLTTSSLYGTAYLPSKSHMRCSHLNSEDEEGQKSTQQNPMPGSQRVEMGGDLGSFDVQMHPEGAGFYVRHVRTGESVEVTIVEPPEPISTSSVDETFVAIDTYVPAKSDRGSTRNLLDRLLDESLSKSTFTFNGSKSPNMHKQRHVVIADMRGNSFECKIKLTYNYDIESDDDNKHSVIETFPCLPGMFGPTDMKSLISGNGVSFESIIYKPEEGDPFGCNDYGSGDNDVVQVPATAPAIYLVHRGNCSFGEKGNNAYKRHNAGGSIVINSDERGLFIMAGTPSEESKRSEVEPISVLVTKLDGNKIMNLMDTYVQKGQIFAKISVLPQVSNTLFRGETSTLNDINWPGVVSSSNSVQVYASQGWGVGAQKANGTWQVVLLQHSFN